MTHDVSARRTLISLVVISAVHGINHTFGIFLSPLNEEIRLFFGATSISAITAFKTTYLLVYALSNLGAGFLARRVSARLVLSIGMVVNGLAIAGFALVPQDALQTMHLFWGLAGLGGGVYHPLAMALVTNNYPDRKGWALGITGVGSGIGFAFGPLISSILARSFGLTWQELALWFGFGGVAFAAVTYLLVVDEGPEELPAPSAEVAAADSSLKTATKSVAWGFLIAVVLIAGTREIAMWSILDVSDFYLVRVFEGQAPTGFFLFLLYIPGVIVQPIIGSLSDRGNRNYYAAGALSFYGLTIVAVALLPQSLLALAYLGMGAAQTATVPTLDGIIADATPNRGRRMAFGVMITFGIGIGAAGPLLFGLVVDSFGGTLDGFRLSFLVLAGLAFLGAVAMAAIGHIRLPSHS
jgi:MFS family permease